MSAVKWPDAGSAPRLIAAAAGVFFLVSGLWAMVDPRSFFDAAATFEPFNRHFIQDIGAFQVGLGAVLLLVATWPTRDALGLGLLGVGIGSLAHLISHIVGHDLGGNPVVDIPFFAVLTALLLGGAYQRLRLPRA